MQGEGHAGGPMSEGDESKLRSLVRQAMTYGYSLHCIRLQPPLHTGAG